MKKSIICLIGCLFISIAVWAGVPSRPLPPRLVCDFAGMMSQAECQELESLLVNYDNETSTQICVVTLNDLEGEDILHLAYEIGQQWGVGSEAFNNGAVILVKNKSRHSDGEVAIATGYGLEALLTDAICRRIIEDELIPHFADGETFEGIQAACSRIMSILQGEFSYEDEDREALIALLVFLVVCTLACIIIAIAIERYNKKHPDKPIRFDGNHKNNKGPTIFIGGGPGFGSTRSGGFSSGSSFGGFGGGSFGGGGAKGRW